MESTAALRHPKRRRNCRERARREVPGKRAGFFSFFLSVVPGGKRLVALFFQLDGPLIRRSPPPQPPEEPTGLFESKKSGKIRSEEARGKGGETGVQGRVERSKEKGVERRYEKSRERKSSLFECPISPVVLPGTQTAPPKAHLSPLDDSSLRRGFQKCKKKTARTAQKKMQSNQTSKTKQAIKNFLPYPRASPRRRWGRPLAALPSGYAHFRPEGPPRPGVPACSSRSRASLVPFLLISSLLSSVRVLRRTRSAVKKRHPRPGKEPAPPIFERKGRSASRRPLDCRPWPTLIDPPTLAAPLLGDRCERRSSATCRKGKGETPSSGKKKRGAKERIERGRRSRCFSPDLL